MEFESPLPDVQDKLLGRKSNWNWGRNSKKEIRFIEKRQINLEILEEVYQDEEEKAIEEENRIHEEKIANHWVNQLILKRGQNGFSKTNSY